jgi:hypothetical protein
LQGSLEAPRWHYAGTVGPWLAFLDAGTRGLSWVVPRDAPEPSVASVPGSDAATAVAWPEGPDTTTVSTPAPALLVRSVPYAPGWRAVVEQPDGTTTTVPVRRIGPVQAVPVPAGRTTVHWIYASAAATAGAWISAATALLALCAGIAVIWRGRRRTGSPRRLLVRRRFASIS